LFDALRQAINAEMELRVRQVEQQRELIQEQIDAQQEAIRGYEESIQAQEELIRSQQAIIDTSRQLATSLQAASRQGAAPQQQLDALTAEFLRLQTQLQGQTGQEALDTIADMQRVLEEAQRLGQETNRLDIIAMANQLLAGLVPRVEAEASRAQSQLDTAQQQLAVLQQQRDAASQSLTALQQQLETLADVREIQAAALAQLKTLESQLYALFQSSQGVQQALGTMTVVVNQDPVVQQLQVVNNELAYQSRLLLGISYGVDAPNQFQSRQLGGMVGARLEPGVLVFPGPLSPMPMPSFVRMPTSNAWRKRSGRRFSGARTRGRWRRNSNARSTGVKCGGASCKPSLSARQRKGEG
jgi:hypothetical protein